MAGPRKRRTLEQKSAGDNENENEQEEMEVETVEADFEGRNPETTDFHGIKQLLKQLFLKSHLNISELVDMVIAQQGIGSVLKQSLDEDDEEEEEDEDTVFGITTVVNLAANKEKECIQQLFVNLKELVEKYADKPSQEQIEQILSDAGKRLGLLVNERFLNIPAKIADPLMGSLQNEIDRFSKKNEDYKFDYYIMICKTHKCYTKDKKEEGTFFVNAEEEMFSDVADISFEFCVDNESDTGVGGFWNTNDKLMVPYRKVLIITASKFPTIVNSVKAFVA